MGKQIHQDFRRITPPLEGRLIRLRAVEEHDLPRINRLFNDPEVLRHLSTVTFPGPLQDTRQWWEGRFAQGGGEVRFAIETRPGELVGASSLNDVNGRTRTATLGIWLGQPYWDQGYGTDAVATMCRFAFREMNLQRVELHVFATNPRGQRAYEKVGFKEEGRLRRAHFVGGEHVDVIVMGLLSEDLVEPRAANRLTG